MLHLHGIGHSHPDSEVTNEFLEELDIGTSNEWILERTGIRSRRTVLDLDYIRKTRNRDPRATTDAMLVSNAELGRRAACKALERAGLDTSALGLVIAGGSIPAAASPAEACMIAAALDLDVPGIDLRSACTSFGAALHMVSMFDRDRAPELILIVLPETMTRSVCYDDRRAAVLWGDCAAAVVVSPTVPGRAEVLSTSLASRPGDYGKVFVPWAGHFEQEGATVQSFAIRQTVKTLRNLQQEFGDAAKERFHFIGHQANLLMLQNVCRSCDIPGDRHLSNVTNFGNTGTAGSASVLSQSWDTLQPGDHVAMVGVGAGLTWTGSMLRFAEGKG